MLARYAILASFAISFFSPSVFAAPTEIRRPAQIPLTVSLIPKKIKTGQVSLLRIAGEISPDVSVTLHRKAKPDSESANPVKFKVWECQSDHCAWVAIPVEAKAGKFEIEISAGLEVLAKPVLEVARAKQHEDKLRVTPSRVNPSGAQQKRIDAEKAEINALYAEFSRTPRWLHEFRLPAKGAITSRYGNRRTFNGELQNTHYGVDLRAQTGVLIRSCSEGKVVLAKETFYAGNLVIVDHGTGVFSTYAHLSAFEVAVGQSVKAGQIVGKAGATGRVTGPHLHWGMRVSDLLVDPHQFLKVFQIGRSVLIPHEGLLTVRPK